MVCEGVPAARVDGATPDGRGLSECGEGGAGREPLPRHQCPAGTFSPASTRTSRRFSAVGSGQVAKAVYTHGGLYA